MQNFSLSAEVKQKFPGFKFFGLKIDNVVVSDKLEFTKKKEILTEFKSKQTPENISSNKLVKSIRELFIAMNVNPDMEPTSVEHLTKILYRNGLPRINSIVDSANIASLGSLMPIGVFDADKMVGDVLLRFSREGEAIEPIGRDKEILNDGILIITDDVGVISRPLYKDSKRTMITKNTKNIYLFTAQYGEAREEDIQKCLNLAAEIINASSPGSKKGEIFEFKFLQS
ncbi:MAG: phenylalanine--tRNA ligase beta subunit-related protein [bacterium]|nr:phenylalanine--tRNA ligase beta subunit-related protein [bacterium]